jgi:hypothetical protein
VRVCGGREREREREQIKAGQSGVLCQPCIDIQPYYNPYCDHTFDVTLFINIIIICIIVCIIIIIIIISGGRSIFITNTTKHFF